MSSLQLAAQFETYAEWRRRLAECLQRLAFWLRERQLVDPQADAQVTQTLGRLALDQLVVAFVAEFSRGKSELINAIFFADYGRRLLPSSAGRTTMCPTELLYTPTMPPSIRLLPIETRRTDEPVSEFRKRPEEWHSIPLDLVSPDRMTEALAEVSRTRRVPVDYARELGLYHDGDALNPVTTDADGTVEVPCWRHAIINFPHALLQQGLVVLDTPGLNAIGAEPELTLNLLPNAHAVVFILAADAGVTRTDIETWQRHVAGDAEVPTQGRVAVLNKIDTLWDGLRPTEEIDAEIERQVQATAALLGVPPDQVFAVSAQKGLVAKITTDADLLERSRLPRLEEALSRELLPAKRDIVAEATRREARAIVRNAEAVLEARLAGLDRELGELGILRGKNHSAVSRMLDGARAEREAFDRGLDHFASLRNDLEERTRAVALLLDTKSLQRNALTTRARIEASSFTMGVRAAMADFFTNIRVDVAEVQNRLAEIENLFRYAYERFSSEQGLEKLVAPPAFEMTPYDNELRRLEKIYSANIDTMWNLISKEKYTLQRKFFEAIALRMKHLYEELGGAANTWLRRLLRPLESQVREHQAQLRQRIESIRRIHEENQDSEVRVAELQESQRVLMEQVRLASQLLARLEHVAREAQQLPLAANQ